MIGPVHAFYFTLDIVIYFDIIWGIRQIKVNTMLEVFF